MPSEGRRSRFRRERLRDPRDFKEGSLRTVRSGSHRIVVGRLKGETVTRAQAILHPRRCRLGECARARLKAAFF